MNYWVLRLTPLINSHKKNWIFCCADRIGKETKNDKTVHYAGTSCVIKSKPLQLIKYLDKCSEKAELIKLEFWFNY